jgi:hypothetical protein
VNVAGHGVRMRSGDVWILDEQEYRLERWDPNRLIMDRVLVQHPMIMSYLLGPYEGYQMTGLHLVNDRYLWVFMRLQIRAPPGGSFDSRVARFAAENDGLVEVIDLERSAIIATRYFPSLDFTGWVVGPIGYRSTPDGSLQLIHCAVETPSMREVP